MDEAAFWELIDEGRVMPGERLRAMTPSASPDRIRALLSKLPDIEVLAFGTLFYRKLASLNLWPLYGAGYVITGGMNDDSFHYFRSWIIGKGIEAYETALRNPEDLERFIDNAEVDNELLEYACLEVLEERGINIDPRDKANCNANDEPEGEPFDEEAVYDDFPRLAERFG